jgi:hypothetical protein
MKTRFQVAIVAASFAANTVRLASADGPVRCWGDNTFGQSSPPTDLGNARMVAGGHNHSLAILSDGTVRCWGQNDAGQCDVPSSLGRVRSIAAGGSFSVAILDSGFVRGWGDNYWGQCTPPPSLGVATGIDAGLAHSVALRSDGTVVAWGYGGYGACDVPGGLSDVSRVAAGAFSGVALRRDGTVIGWGSRGDGAFWCPQDLSDLVDFASTYFWSTAIRADRSVRSWENGVAAPADVGPCWQIAGGGYHVAAITSNGSIRCWGDDGSAQCQVPEGVFLAEAVAAGRAHSLAIVAPDCDGNGIADFIDIKSGSVADLNTDGVPDTCQQPTCTEADLFANGVVNGADLGILLSEWGSASAGSLSDINLDGQVDGSDLGTLLAFWGPCTN